MSSSSQTLNYRVLSRRKRALLVVWFLTTLGLGAWGYFGYEQALGEGVSFATALYHSAQLFILHAPHFSHPVNLALEGARWSAAVFFGATLYQIAGQLFPREFAALRCWRFSGHVIVGGLGRRALQCVRGERGKPRRERRNVVVIDRTPPDDLAAASTELGAQIIIGDVNDPAVLRAAGVRRAAELWALCAEDSVNCETAVQAGRVLTQRPRGGGGGKRRPPLRCNVHLSDIDLRVELQRYAGRAVSGAPLALRFFDLYDFEARRVLLDVLPLDHDGIGAGETRRAHLVILGLGRMGRSLAVRAAKLGHFANGAPRPDRRLRISVIDRAGGPGEAALLFRYPRFREVCDLECHSVDIESPAARRLVEGWCGDPASLTSLAVCFDDEARAVEVALRLLPVVEPNAVRVAVRMSHRGGLGNLVDRVWADSGGAARIRTFGRLDEGCCEAALDESIQEGLAQAIHQDYVRQRLAQGAEPSDRSLADWHVLDEDLRESNRQQADHLVIKLRTIGCERAPAADPRPPVGNFAEAEVELLARLEHDRWNAERILAGWSLGERNAQLRTSPYLCEWDALPESVREYDRAAVRAIPELLHGTGRKAVRR